MIRTNTRMKATLLGAASALLTLPALPMRASDTVPLPKMPPPIYRPDVAITDVLPSYIWNGSSWVQEPNAVWFQVANLGAKDTGMFFTLLEWNMDPSQSSYQGYSTSFVTMNLAPQKWQWILAHVNGYNLWAPNSNFRLRTDFTNVLKESDETNNIFIRP